MFRIGDFSRIARVSCRLLRYYDEIGLLRPATIDQSTHYRYYSAAQLPQLNRILVLRDLGLSLDEIATILQTNLSPADLRELLHSRRAEIVSALATEQERLRQIDTRIAQIDAVGELVADDVIVRAEPAQWLLSTRQIVPSFSAAREVIAAVVRDGRRAIPDSARGALIAIAHSPEFEPDRLDVEIGYLLRNATNTRAKSESVELTLRELPAIPRLATCVRVGPPEQAHLITSRIGSFVEANGYRLEGPSRELFLQPPRLDRMEESVVEMQFPIAAS